MFDGANGKTSASDILAKGT